MSFKSNWKPITLVLSFPPNFVLNIPRRNGKVWMIRAGVRYDRNWKGYIFPAAAGKEIEDELLY